LSESKPAEALAAELACRDRRAVLSRDVYVVKAVGGCGGAKGAVESLHSSDPWDKTGIRRVSEAKHA